ncbi:cupin domain-containing protein [Glycocaulis sp.]|uniref:cupin domain-containing protein n=1 Tax=Glycocaulis sp. TaxID=1969725 RepID=UPI003F6EDCD6
MELCLVPAREDAHLFDYAAGTGPAAIRLLAECQAALNPQAAIRVSVAEAGFGCLLSQLPPAAMSENALDHVLEHAGTPITSSEQPSAIDTETGLPRALTPFLEMPGGELDWSRQLGGVQEIHLADASDANVEANLVRLMPGGGIPHHDHGGEELTLVLTGAFHDGHALYRAGDLCRATPGLRHRPEVHGATPCICLTVSLGEWKPANPLYGWLNRLNRSLRRRN